MTHSAAHGNALSLYADASAKVSKIDNEIDQYNDMFKDDAEGKKRKSEYMTMVNNFYDVVTDFYEYGWGHSFHFASRFKDEAFQESLKRSEYFMASKLGLKPGMKALDVGCGIGGPMRNIAKFSEASITGINNNDYQIKRASRINEQNGVGHLCSFILSDFMTLKVAPRSYDAAFAIEATCHSPDKTACFREIYKTLKPGGLFCVYEWCMTDKYDPNNQKHNDIKFGIEQGNSLPPIVHYTEVDKSMKAAGFEVVESFDTHKDMNSPHQIPWYRPLSPQLTPDGIVFTQYGQLLTTYMVGALEFVKLAPKGSSKVQAMLTKTSKFLVLGGETGIFTPDYFVLVRKPVDATD